MNPLALLSSLLAEAAGATPVSLRENTDIDVQLERLTRESKSGGRSYEPRDLQVEAVQRFRLNPRFESLRDARLVSFGLSLDALGTRKCLMEDDRLFSAALSGADEWRQVPRQFRKCYQGLMRSYFDYDGLGRTVSDVGKQNWGRLRQYLRARAPSIVDSRTNPDWVMCVGENPDLLTSTPCVSFAHEIALGREERVKQVRDLLGITDASWFTRELVLAQIEQATRLPHPKFRNVVSGLLNLLGDNEVLRDRGLGLVLNRYARIPQTPQDDTLKERAVAAWGNPWLPSNKDRWGSVETAAKDMVSDWLKLEFIELFFTKLAQGGIGDARRVAFWQGYVKSIHDIRFALGSNAMYSTEKDFKELRAKLKGLLVSLEDTEGSNNAFVMMMGDLVAVEFSSPRNACYGYSGRKRLPFDLSKPLLRSPIDGPNSLKTSAHLLRLRHADNVKGFQSWEARFAAVLKAEFQIQPGKASATRVVVPSANRPPPQRGARSSPGLGTRSPWTEPSASGTRAPTPPPPGVQTKMAPAQPRTTRAFELSPGTLTDVAAPKGVVQAFDSAHRRTPTFSNGDAAAPRINVPTPECEPFNETNLNALASRIPASVDDRTSNGGALWLVGADGGPETTRILRSWGFKYKRGKGWWRRPEE